MEKLGAKDESELTVIFWCHICLKSKKAELIQWEKRENEKRANWLKSLSKEEARVLIEYELYNRDCVDTWCIEPVREIFKGIYGYDLIRSVYWKVQDDIKSK